MPTTRTVREVTDVHITEAVCRNCGESLENDGLWGWMHQGDRYLCRDTTTGELLCSPAEPK